MNTTRTYRQTRRQRDTQARRDRILDATETVLTGRAVHDFTVDEIAEAAEVARATVFTQFESKAGLLAALVERMTERGGVERLAKAFDLPDSVAAVEAVLEIGTDLLHQESALYATLVAYAAVDHGVAAALAAKDDGRRRAMRHLAARLADDGHLADGVTRAEAERLLDLITSHQTHVQLAAGLRSRRAIVSGLRHLTAGFVPALRNTNESRPT